MHDEVNIVTSDFAEVWFKPYQDLSTIDDHSSALFCRFSNRLQVDAKMVKSKGLYGISYYDFGNSHAPGKIPPHSDSSVKKFSGLNIHASKMKLKERISALTRFGEPLPVGEEKWAWRGNEVNLNARRNQAENGEGTGSTFFYSMLGDLNDFIKVRFIEAFYRSSFRLTKHSKL